MTASEQTGSRCCFAGVDVGASGTKAVIINDRVEILGSAVCRSGGDFAGASKWCVDESLKQARLDEDAVAAMISTGYGRTNVPYRCKAVTEISCQARGCYHYFPRAITIVDIGGQDNKVIELAHDGTRLDFQMNRKCAAGTGAFLEEIAGRLNLEMDRLEPLARKSTEKVELGAYCTVFTSTEILTKLREGVKVEDLVRAVFGSVVKRIMEMTPLEGEIVLTGGVIAHNPILLEMLEEHVSGRVLVPPEPQLTCALGAAITARGM